MTWRFFEFAFAPLLLLSGLMAPFQTVALRDIDNPPKTATQDKAGAPKRISAESSFVVAGFIPDYQIGTWSGDVDSLTDLIYFGVSVSKDGRFDSTGFTAGHARMLKEKKEASRCRLLFSAGGWNKSEGFATLAADDKLRVQWVNDAIAFCLKHGFNGIDYDWEHPKGEEQIESYTRLLKTTRKAFADHRLIVTVSMAPWQDLGKDAFEAVHRVHLMSYDHDFPHATMDKSKADVNRLLKAGCPPGKIAMGIPFYGRNKEGQTKPYAELAKGKALVGDVDIVDGYAFNGPATIAAKVRFARENKLAGVMIWELGQDLSGADSLLKRIGREVGADR